MHWVPRNKVCPRFVILFCLGNLHTNEFLDPIISEKCFTILERSQASYLKIMFMKNMTVVKIHYFVKLIVISKSNQCQVYQSLASLNVLKAKLSLKVAMF